MIQRIMLGILAVFTLFPAHAAFDQSDPSGLVWQSPDWGPDTGWGPEPSLDKVNNMYRSERPVIKSRPFGVNNSTYREPGLKVNHAITGEGWGGQYSFSGGADLMHGNNAPAGFNDNSKAKMPLLTQEMIEDDGGAALVMSVSDRKYNDKKDAGDGVMIDGGDTGGGLFASAADLSGKAADKAQIAPVGAGADVVRSWVVVSGKTLRQVLEEWAQAAGWELVWNTSREYPVAASAVFEGRFMDVSSALVRNFSRANPVPYARFYKGNKVLVVSTLDEGENNGH
ncbi:MAG: toxin co-regulated pilus biosynthesis Q family protein [Rickettsiales bacterium]|jgi:hypothetical protein|nr:toxin co-regulated pilus biosynthesis Q family protein [Rickettsiales bacterium]